MVVRVALLLLTGCLVDAHRSLPSGVTCGSQFFTPDDALTIPNPKVSWASYRIFTCDEPVFWLEAQVDADQNLAVTVTVPVLERFHDVRMSVAFTGPDLPALTDDVNVPEEVRQYSLETGFGVLLINSPQDQTTCDHLASDLMKQESSVVDGRCLFYDQFGGSNSWVVMDETVPAPAAGLYKIAVFEETGKTAKAAFVCCDSPEDFITNYDIPEPECPFCGTSEEENPAWLSHFYEQKSMADYGGFPAAGSCEDPDNATLGPAEELCPPIPEPDGTEAQPSSCALGCDSDGECHSHNVFGECTHLLDWSLNPRFGEAEVSRVVIFKGDKISFRYLSDTGSAHNLFEMATGESLEQCDFSDATAVANVEEIGIGHMITFDEAGEFFFSCGISCTSLPGGSEAETRQETVNNPSCHCTVGQKLTVEVKDSSEGLRCHDHAQVSKDEPALLTCEVGNVPVFVIDNADYFAMDETQCAEFCTSSVAVQFMQGVELGTCLSRGYTIAVSRKTATPPNSPQSFEVLIKTNTDVSTCHCHSYEEISCPEDETPEDTHYSEHIVEIEEHCAGIIDRSEEDCPYKCFQPMEGLHLHYLECGSREIDSTYLAVNATEKCHIAATAPAGAECPTVSLDGHNAVGGGEGGTSGAVTVQAWTVLAALSIVLPSFSM